jgi:hypothetical protein
MSFDGLLVHKIYKNTPYSSQNDFGEYSYSYSTQTATGITCRVSPLQGMETIDTTGKYDNVRYKCFMDDSETINTGDRVVYGSDIYRVKELTKDSNSHHKTALLTQL